jgi:integrase
MSWTKTRDPRLKRRGGETLWLRFSKKKIRVEESLETTNWALAVDIANKVETAILSGEDYKKILNPSAEEIKEELLKSPLVKDLFPLHLLDITNGNPKKKIKKLRTSTVSEKSNYWDGYFEPFFGNLRLDEISGEDGLDLWEKYIEFARNKSAKKENLKIFNHWKHFSAFLSWCEIMGHFKDGMKRPEIYNPDETTFQDQIENEEDGVGINFTDDQLKRFREGSANFVKDPTKSTKLYPEFHLWIMMAQFMGMRSSEITQLHKTRIKISEGMIALRKSDTKTKEARTFAIHPEVIPLIKAQLARSGGRVLIFSLIVSMQLGQWTPRDLKSHGENSENNLGSRDVSTISVILMQVGFLPCLGLILSWFVRRSGCR